MLIGIIATYAQTGSFDLAAMKRHPHPVDRLGPVLSVGMLSKSATLPFQTPLTGRWCRPLSGHGAPPCGGAREDRRLRVCVPFIVTFPSSEQEMKLAVILLSRRERSRDRRCGSEGDGHQERSWRTLRSARSHSYFWVGIRERDRRGGGPALYSYAGTAKVWLFLCAGYHRAKRPDKGRHQIGGVPKTMPMTAVSFLFCAFSAMGIPPFGGFFSKYMVKRGPSRRSDSPCHGVHGRRRAHDPVSLPPLLQGLPR